MIFQAEAILKIFAESKSKQNHKVQYSKHEWEPTRVKHLSGAQL